MTPRAEELYNRTADLRDQALALVEMAPAIYRPVLKPVVRGLFDLLQEIIRENSNGNAAR